MKMTHFRITAGRASSDPEKCVLPAIIFATAEVKSTRACVVALGWWDWNVSFRFGWERAA